MAEEDFKKGYDGDKDAFDFSENDGKRTCAGQPLSAGEIIRTTIRPIINGIKALVGKGDNSDENK